MFSQNFNLNFLKPLNAQPIKKMFYILALIIILIKIVNHKTRIFCPTLGLLSIESEIIKWNSQV